MEEEGEQMDPLTLFALANGAVSAVKAGCKLYKDIKGAADSQELRGKILYYSRAEAKERK